MQRSSKSLRIYCVAVACLVLVTSCSGGEGSSGNAPALAEAVATTMRPTRDGYSFANFSAKGTP